MMCWTSVVLPDDSGPIDLDHPPARDAADAERDVQRDRAGRDDVDRSCRDWASPSFMIEPLPNCFSICETAMFEGLLLVLVHPTSLLHDNSVDRARHQRTCLESKIIAQMF